jgi:hypothetical protein
MPSFKLSRCLFIEDILDAFSSLIKFMTSSKVEFIMGQYGWKC